MEYKKGAGIVYSLENEMPVVGEIESIFIVNGEKVLFYVKCFSSIYFKHFHAFKLESLDTNKTLTIEELVLPSPVHIRVVSSFPQQSIILPYHLGTLL